MSHWKVREEGKSALLLVSPFPGTDCYSRQSGICNSIPGNGFSLADFHKTLVS